MSYESSAKHRKSAGNLRNTPEAISAEAYGQLIRDLAEANKVQNAQKGPEINTAAKKAAVDGVFRMEQAAPTEAAVKHVTKTTAAEETGAKRTASENKRHALFSTFSNIIRKVGKLAVFLGVIYAGVSYVGTALVERTLSSATAFIWATAPVPASLVLFGIAYILSAKLLRRIENGLHARRLKRIQSETEDAKQKEMATMSAQPSLG